MIGYLDKVIRTLVLMMPKMTGYVKALKVKEGDKDKNNKLMSFRIDDEKLSEKYEAIWTKIDDLENFNLNTLPVYDDRDTKTKTWTYSNKVYTNFPDWNVPEEDKEGKLFIVISIDSLLVYGNKYYLQVYWDNCAYKNVNKQIADYFDENLFEY